MKKSKFLELIPSQVEGATKIEFKKCGYVDPISKEYCGRDIFEGDYCKEHLEVMLHAARYLRCSECPLEAKCEKAHKQFNDICYEEWAEGEQKVRYREDLDKVYNELINSERRMMNRMERLYEGTRKIEYFQAYKDLADRFQRHVDGYARFKGWDALKVAEDAKSRALEFQKIILEKRKCKSSKR